MLLYRADDDGLVEAALALMSTARDTEWLVRIYVRMPGDGGKPTQRREGEPPAPPSYDEQPVPDLPPVRRRDRPDEKEITS